ncbi:hypothetical protein ACWFNE_06780 [Cellulomonas sp. NPDC055163]
MAEMAAMIVAALALLVSVLQWIAAQRSEKVRLLLGEKESAGYQALQIVRKPGAKVPDDVLWALMLVTIFESSDRARIQVYRALDELRPSYERTMKDFRGELVKSGTRYADAVDIDSLRARLRQLDRAVPWIAVGGPQLPPQG